MYDSLSNFTQLRGMVPYKPPCPDRSVKSLQQEDVGKRMCDKLLYIDIYVSHPSAELPADVVVSTGQHTQAH